MGVVGLYLGLAVLMTWPVSAHLGDSMAGYPADNRLFVWTPWVFRREVMSGGDPLYTTAIYHPEGVSLALHAVVTTKSVPGLVLQEFLSPVSTFNVLLIASLALCGYGTWLLVRHMTRDYAAAFVSGIIFAFSPVLLAHTTAGHLDYVSAEGFPIFALFFVRALKGKQCKDAVWAGLAAAYTGLSNWTYLLFLVIFCVLYLVYCLISDRPSHLRWPILRQYAIVALVAGICCAPLLIPAFVASGSGTYDITRYVGGSALYVSDLLGFITPSPDHFLVGSTVQPVFDLFTGGRFEGTVYLGVSVLVLAALGWWRARGSQRGFWLGVTILFAVLSLGPGLHVIGKYQFPGLSWLRMGTVAEKVGVPMRPEWVQMFNEAPMVPLPGAVLQLLPIFRWARAPSRFVVVVMLALAVLAGHGVARVREQLRDRRWRGIPAAPVVATVFGVLVLLEFCIVPFPTTTATIPSFYRDLAAEPGEFAILELPIRPFQLWPQYWQTAHGRHLLYGHVSRVPEERFQYLEFIEEEVLRPTGYFEEVDVRYLVLHQDQLASLEAGKARALGDALEANFALVRSEGDMLVYCGHGDCTGLEMP